MGVAGAARADDTDDAVAKLTDGKPPAVIAVIQRRVGCNRYFKGPDYDMALSASPRAPMALRRLQCNLVDQDEKILHYRYRHAPDIRHAFEEADKTGY